MNLGLESSNGLDGMGSISMTLENIVKELPGNSKNSGEGDNEDKKLDEETINEHKEAPITTSEENPTGDTTKDKHEGERRVLLVAATSRAKQVAGSIAQTMREASPPLLSAVGSGSVNQAVKAIAIARTYLKQDGVDISCEISRKPGEQIRDLIHFTLLRQQISHDNDIVYEDLKSSAKSKRGALAGAIANNIRENKVPRITSIGKGPVFQAVTSIIRARKYLGELL